MSFKKSLEILKSLPPEEQELIAGTFYRPAQPPFRCALAAVFRVSNYEEDNALRFWYNGTSSDEPTPMDTKAQELELSREEAHRLAELNDGFRGPMEDQDARRTRYRKVIAALEEKINHELQEKP